MRLYARVRVYAWAACPFVYNGCVCWDEEERRIASRLPKPGSSGGHNRSRLTQRTGLQQVVWRGRGGRWASERTLRGEPGQPHCELQPHGEEEHHSSSFFHSWSGLKTAHVQGRLAGLGSAGDQVIITLLIHPSTLMRSAGVCFQLPIDFQ